jgi:hypothetical protein
MRILHWAAYGDYILFWISFPKACRFSLWNETILHRFPGAGRLLRWPARTGAGGVGDQSRRSRGAPTSPGPPPASPEPPFPKSKILSPVKKLFMRGVWEPKQHPYSVALPLAWYFWESHSIFFFFFISDIRVDATSLLPSSYARLLQTHHKGQGVHSHLQPAALFLRTSKLLVRLGLGTADFSFFVWRAVEVARATRPACDRLRIVNPDRKFCRESNYPP